jgi:hypothetical protein
MRDCKLKITVEHTVTVDGDDPRLCSCQCPYLDSYGDECLLVTRLGEVGTHLRQVQHLARRSRRCVEGAK